MAVNKAETRDRLTVTKELNGPGRVTIYWERIYDRQESWTAHRLMSAKPHTRMRDLDTANMLEVFKWIRDILADKVPDEVLMH